MIKKFFQWLSCLTGDHDWTCAAEQGIKATPEQLKDIDGFWDYATMYCNRCGHQYKDIR